eukprot:COSAG01_NODE_4412_length_5051_cov_2.786349_4_plen_114_part_00
MGQVQYDEHVVAANVFCGGNASDTLVVALINAPHWGQRPEPNATVQVSISMEAFRSCAGVSPSSCQAVYPLSKRAPVTWRVQGVEDAGSPALAHAHAAVQLRQGFAAVVCDGR